MLRAVGIRKPRRVHARFWGIQKLFRLPRPLEEIKRQEHARILVAERDRRRELWLKQTSIDRQFEYAKLSFLDSFYAYSLFIGAEVDDDGELKPSMVPEFSPDREKREDVAHQLYQKNVFLFGKGTQVDAFIPNADGLSFQFDLSKISWRFALPTNTGSIGSILPQLLQNLTSGSTRQDHWEVITAIWWDIARTDAFSYLSTQAESYGLTIQHGKSLDGAVDYVLGKFSIPQVRNLIWRVSRDAAAYSAKRGVLKAQATNSIPSALTRMCDRYKANNWEVTPYVRRWDTEESILTTTLFDLILGTGINGFRNLTGEKIAIRPDANYEF